MTAPPPALLQQLLIEAITVNNVLPLTGHCNLSCCFCSHRQNPPGVAAYTFGPLPSSRLLELMEGLDPAQKIIIGESATRLREGEPLTHPEFSLLLRALRRLFPDTLIQLTTNGTLLDRKTARLLAGLAPLEVVLSLNSATASGRQLLMGDHRPEHALQAVEELAPAGVTFHGSLVAMPHLVGWDDLTATARYLDRHKAATIRLLLPGFTRYSDPALVFPPQTAERCYRLGEQLNRELQAPGLAEPPLINNLDPVVEGVLAGSPAARAKAQKGDLIVAVDGCRPATRVQAFREAYRRRSPELTLLRNGRTITARLEKEASTAPGLVLSYDLDPAQVDRVCNRLDGGTTLMLVSQPALLRWNIAREKFALENLYLAPVEASFFGGSINCAGLLTVSDFQAALNRELPRISPRQIILPAVAFDRTGRDMRNRKMTPGPVKKYLIE